MNGFSESMLDALPSRNTPPSLAPPAAVVPHPAADKATATATATTAEARRIGRVVRADVIGSSLTLRHLRSRTTAARNVPARRLAAGRVPVPASGVLPI